jgi:hypothetical protein
VSCHRRRKNHNVSTTADMRYHAHFPYDPDIQSCVGGRGAGRAGVGQQLCLVHLA